MTKLIKLSAERFIICVFIYLIHDLTSLIFNANS